MATKTRRVELRTDEATERLIAEAASLTHTTRSAFVVDAARLAAQRVIARSEVTLMAPEVFDSLVTSLDVADGAPELSEKLSRLPRLIAR